VLKNVQGASCRVWQILQISISTGSLEPHDNDTSGRPFRPSHCAHYAQMMASYSALLLLLTLYNQCSRSVAPFYNATLSARIAHATSSSHTHHMRANQPLRCIQCIRYVNSTSALLVSLPPRFLLKMLPLPYLTAVAAAGMLIRADESSVLMKRKVTARLALPL